MSEGFRAFDDDCRAILNGCLWALICTAWAGLLFAGLKVRVYLWFSLSLQFMVGGYALFDSIMNGVGAGLAGMLGNFMQNALVW